LAAAARCGRAGPEGQRLLMREVRAGRRWGWVGNGVMGEAQTMREKVRSGGCA